MQREVNQLRIFKRCLIGFKDMNNVKEGRMKTNASLTSGELAENL